MTKKEIKEKINQLEVDIRKLRSYENIEGYKALCDKIQEMKDSYDKQIQSSWDNMYTELNDLKCEYKKPVKEKLFVPKHLQNWLYNWMRGVNFGYNDPYIKWISPDEKYVIITTPGGTAGQGTAMGSGSYYYSPTKQYLVKVIEGAGWHDRIKSEVAECEGRLSKEKLNEWMKLIETL